MDISKYYAKYNKKSVSKEHPSRKLTTSNVYNLEC